MGSPQNAFERMMQAAAAAKKQDPSTPVKTPSKRSASKQAQQTPKRLRPAGGIAAAAATAEAAALQPQHDRQASDHLNVISNQGHVGNVNIPTVPNNVEGPAAAAAISADVWLTTAELPAGGSSATVDLTPIPAHQQEHEQVQQQEDETAPSSSIEPHQPAAAAGMLPQQQIAAPSTGSTEQHAAAVAAFKSVFQSQKHARQKYDYLLVYDLEATCNRARTLQPVEIIELSCVIVDTKAAQITSSFQAYVQPTEHPQLDPFCVELTGIQQHQVDAAEQLQPVLQRHHTWLEQQGMFAEGVRFVAVTWTDWDLAICLCAECAWRCIQRPQYLCSWVDLKRKFFAKYKQRGNLRNCAEAAGLRWQGRAHSGLDDATNTARLAIKLMSQGVVMEITQTSENPPVEQQQQQTKNLAGGSRPPAGGGTSSSSSRGRVAAAASGSSGAIKCDCGVKANLRTTKRPGPNHGRQFYSCGTWTVTRKQSSGCGFFVWLDELGSAGS